MHKLNYEQELEPVINEYYDSLTHSNVLQDEFAATVSDHAEFALVNYNLAKQLLDKHPELATEPLFKNISDQHAYTLETDETHEGNVEHYNFSLVDFDKEHDGKDVE